jgi:acyl dehydratase
MWKSYSNIGRRRRMARKGAGSPMLYDWRERDVLCYALGVGCGIENEKPSDLQFIREHGIIPLPTFVTVPARQAMVALLAAEDPDQFSMLIHQKVSLYSALQPSASVRLSCALETAAAGSKGQGSRRLARTQIDGESGERIAIVESQVISRRLGSDRVGRKPWVDAPIALAETFATLRTLPNQALLYSLCGDRNPLHVDPESARSAGFARPVLHGLCTFGLSCRAVISTYCPADPGLLLSHEADFCAPVYPGDTLRFDMRRKDDSVLFEGFAVERARKVIRNGKTMFKEPGLIRYRARGGAQREGS